jgi:hypothetical protein
MLSVHFISLHPQPKAINYPLPTTKRSVEMSNETRDAAIFKLWQRGRNGNTMPRWTYERIAARYGVTTHRINQIIADQKLVNKWRGKRAA